MIIMQNHKSMYYKLANLKARGKIHMDPKTFGMLSKKKDDVRRNVLKENESIYRRQKEWF